MKHPVKKADLKTHSQRVIKSRRKALAAGAVRVDCILRGDAALALKTLLKQGYGENKNQVIARALIEAASNY